MPVIGLACLFSKVTHRLVYYMQCRFKHLLYRSYTRTLGSCMMYRRIILMVLGNTFDQWLFCWWQKRATCMASCRLLG